MTWKRILRDGSIVAVLCAAFYFSASAIDKFVESEDRVFSTDRRSADQHFSERRWELASFHYQKLTELDPYNGYAWFQQAVCQLGLRNELNIELKARKEEGAGEEELQLLESKRENILDQAIDCFVHAKEFLRHRRRSLINLAIVYVEKEDADDALRCLEIYVKEGSMLTRTLDQIASLGAGGRSMIDQDSDENPNAGLHRFQKFWDLVELENRVRSGNSNGRIQSFLP